MRGADTTGFGRSAPARTRGSGAGSALATVVLLIGCAVSLLQLHANDIDDPFHYGEYFSYFTSLSSGTFTGQAISLHGALEYAPAWLARLVVDSQHYLFWTIVFLSVLSVIAAALFMGAVAELLRDAPDRDPLLVVIALTTPLLMSSREVFLFGGLWFALRLLRERPSGRVGRVATEIAIGVASAFGVFWSFDRGIVQLVAIGAPAALLVWRRPTFRIAALAWIVSMAVLGFGTRVFSLAGYVDNLTFILDVSGQFSYGWTRDSVLLKAAGLAITIVVMLLMLLVARRNRRPSDPLVALMLALMCAAALRVVSYRADVWHLPALLWAPILALAHAHERLADTPDRRYEQWALGVIALVVALLAAVFASYGKLIFVDLFLLLGILLCPAIDPRHLLRRRGVPAVVALAVALLLVRFHHAVRDDGFAWLARTGATPANATIVPDEMNAIVAALRAHRVACVMDMSNRGLINGLLDLPACTRVTYPVYATSKYEDEMIRQLDASRVSALVYSATAWPYRIDGLSMPVRFPRLDAFIRDRYPVLECTPLFCIRAIRPADPGALVSS